MNTLGPIFNFVPGDQSPPPAPRQTTTRPRVRRSSANKVDANSSQPDPNVAAPAPLPQTAFGFGSSQGATSPNPATNAPRWMHARGPSMQSRTFDVEDIPIDPELTDSAISSERGDEVEVASAQKTNGRKRQRRQPQQQERQHHLHQRFEVAQSSPATPAQPGHVFYGDEILDHLTLLQGAGPDAEFSPHPEPPVDFHPDTPLDKDCHTALHWGAALADINLVSDFIARGASIGALSTLGETPLTFASQYTNSFERRTMPRLIGLLGSTVDQADVLGCTALHHAATLTSQPNLALAGRYYFDTILDYLGHNFSSQDMLRVLDARNVDGDTALIIVARQGDQASVRTLISYGAGARIVNDAGKSANDYLRERRERAQWKRELESGGSPPGFHGLASAPPGGLDGAADDDDETLHGALDSRRDGWRLPNGTSKPRDGPVSVLDRLSRRVDEPLNRELERIEADDVEITAALARVEAERAQIRARGRGPAQGSDGDGNGSAAEAAALLAAENELRELLTLLESRELLRTMSLSTSKSHEEEQQQQQQQPQAKLQRQNEEDPTEAPVTLFSNDGNKTQDPSTAQVLSDAIDEQEQRRQRLIAEVVQKTAAAGSRERASRYKTLIAQCLNVGEQELQSLAPAILEHLEAERERKFSSSATTSAATAMADPAAPFGRSARAASAAALVAGAGH